MNTFHPVQASRAVPGHFVRLPGGTTIDRPSTARVVVMEHNSVAGRRTEGFVARVGDETERRWLLPLSVAVLMLLAISGWHPYERSTWWMEVAPILLAAPVLVLTSRRFPLTSLLYVLIAVHAVILLVGGAYTYAQVPAGFWVQELFGLSRNPYDKLGHFAQGFVPALIAREIFIRLGIVRAGAWPAVLAVACALSVSLIYELVEWGAAVALGQGAEAFLGTQGDPWDTQSDMGMAFLGAVAAVAVLSRVHDGQIKRLRGASHGHPT